MDTLVNAANCDSIVTLNLTINKSDSTTVDSTICANALPLTWNGQEFTEAGTKSVTLSTVNQCDSVVIMTLNVNALPDMSLLTVTNNTSCGEPNGSILVTVAGGADCTYSLNNGDFQSSPVFSNLEEGTYTVTVRSSIRPLSPFKR